MLTEGGANEDTGEQFYDTVESTDITPLVSDDSQVPDQPQPIEPVVGTCTDVDYSDTVQLENVLQGFKLKKIGAREVGYAGKIIQ